MNSTSFSTIVSKDSMPNINVVMDYLQLNSPGTKICVAKIEDGKDDVLFHVLANNLMPGQEGLFARRFLNAVEKPEHKSTLPLMTFTEYPTIKTPEQLQEKVDEYRDGSCKVRVYKRNWKKP